MAFAKQGSMENAQHKSNGNISLENPAPKHRKVNYEFSQNLADLLLNHNLTVLVSTYQAGKLAVVGALNDAIALGFHNFDRPMGVATNATRDRLAVAARDRIWMLKNVPDVARNLSPETQYDDCWLTRSALVTGEIQAHELSWCGDELWVGNTLFSCLCNPHPNFSFVPRWRPPFISQLAPEDRCHLNGLACQNGHPKFVTAMAETDSAGGWRENKISTGCVIDVDSGETVARGFAMPHSPRLHNQKLWLLDSGRGSLVCLDPGSGEAEVVGRFPGYTRGLTIVGNLAFVGLSKIRETSTFGGVTIAEEQQRLKCGVAVMDLARGSLVGQFEFKSGVDEIFDVSVLTNARMAAMRGPFAHDDGEQTIWVVPPESESTES